MTIDVIFLMVLLYGFYVGFGEGFIRALFSILSIFIATLAAFQFSPTVTHTLETGFQINNPLMFILGFVLTFFGVRFGVKFLAGSITDIMAVAHVNLINQLVGGITMATLFSVIYSLLVWFADEAHMIEPITKAQSVSYRFLEPLPGKTKDVLIMLKPSFIKFWDEASHTMDQMRTQNTIQKAPSRPDIYTIPDDGSQTNSSGR